MLLVVTSCTSHDNGSPVIGAGGGGGVFGIVPGAGGVPAGGAINVPGGAAGTAVVNASGGAPGARGASVGGAAPGALGMSSGGIGMGAGGGVAATGGAPGAGGAVVLPPGTQQYTFTMDQYQVDPGAEFYGCQDIPNPFGADVAIVKTESTVSLGAHHLYAFQIPTEQAEFNSGAPATTPPFTPDGKKTPIFTCPGGGFEFHPYIHLSQRQDDVISYPDAVGRSLKAAEAIRMMVHYLNTEATPISVGAKVTVNYRQATEVPQLAAGIFVFAPALQVPTGMSTLTFSFPVTQDMNFLQVTGHMHRRGKHYEAIIRSAAGDVRPFYTSDSWEEPPTQNFSPPLVLKSGDTVEYTCTYQNDTGMTLTYGESAASNEMCNIFGVFFPAPNGAGIFGPAFAKN